MSVYLRPCPMIGDIEFPEGLTKDLVRRGYITPEDEWPGDYHFAHEDHCGPLDEVKANKLTDFLTRNGVPVVY
jgi:hypothetical protein